MKCTRWPHPHFLHFTIRPSSIFDRRRAPHRMHRFLSLLFLSIIFLIAIYVLPSVTLDRRQHKCKTHSVIGYPDSVFFAPCHSWQQVADVSAFLQSAFFLKYGPYAFSNAGMASFSAARSIALSTSNSEKINRLISFMVPASVS